MIKKIKIFSEGSHQALEKEVNNFLKNIAPEDVLEIRFNTPMAAGDYCHLYYINYLAMIVYNKLFHR